MSGSSTVFTLDNTSPLLRYSQEWTEGNITYDSEAALYSNKTFTVTTTFGATMNFEFNGTSILIAGAKRPNHGPYSVTFDGRISNYNGFSDSDVFQTPLFQADGLTQGLHNVTLTNLAPLPDKPWIDVDFVQWTSVNSAGDTGSTTTRTVEDNDPSFDFQPAGSWSTDLTGRAGFSSSNGHIATSQDAHMALTFTGTTVQLIGSVGPDHGSYYAWMDGIGMGSFNATKARYVAQQTLFLADNLGDGLHTLKLTIQGDNVVHDRVLGIDYAVISKTTSLSTGDGSSVSTSGGSSTSTSDGSSTSASDGSSNTTGASSGNKVDEPSSSKAMNKGTYAGIALGVVAVILLAAAVYWLWRKLGQRQRSRTLAERGIVIDDQAQPDPEANGDHVPPNWYSNRVTREVGSLVVMEWNPSATGQPQSPGGSVYRLDPELPNPHESRMYIPGREQDFGPVPVMASLPMSQKR